MIEYFYEEALELDEAKYTDWLLKCVKAHHKTIGQLSYVFCSDEYLLKLNREYLDHDYYTDILTFPGDNVLDEINGDIFISLDRVKENAKEYNNHYEEELRRVMSHGILHLIGFKDESDTETLEMRKAEEACLKLFHVKH